MKNDRLNAPANAIWILLGFFILCILLILTCSSKPKDAYVRIAMIEILIDEKGQSAMRARYDKVHFRDPCDVMSKIHDEWARLCTQQGSMPYPPKPEPTIRFGE